MSAYSTLYITRSKAKEFIIDKIANMCDSELEEIMDMLLEKGLNNCIIVSDDDENADWK